MSARGWASPRSAFFDGAAGGLWRILISADLGEIVITSGAALLLRQGVVLRQTSETVAAK